MFVWLSVFILVFRFDEICFRLPFFVTVKSTILVGSSLIRSESRYLTAIEEEHGTKQICILALS